MHRKCGHFDRTFLLITDGGFSRASSLAGRTIEWGTYKGNYLAQRFF